MDKYTIYCTPEQTKKALELGAPIRKKAYPIEILNRCYVVNHKGQIKIIPTAEEMIGWLEENNIILSIIPHDLGTCGYVYNIEINDNIYIDKCYYSRKEAILATIDAALEYLSRINDCK